MSISKRGLLAALLLGSLFVLASCGAIRTQLDAGIFTGVAVGGRQDLKTFVAGRTTEQQSASPSPGFLLGGGFRLWWVTGCSSFGIGAELDHWETALWAEDVRVEQERFALLGSVLVRCPIAAAKEAFLYGGPVGGGVLTKTNGHGEFGPAIGLLAGFDFPLAARLRLGMEAVGLCTRDANGGLPNGARVKTSGSSASLAHAAVGAHGDTCSLLARVRLAVPF